MCRNGEPSISFEHVGMYFIPLMRKASVQSFEEQLSVEKDSFKMDRGIT